MPAFHKLNFPPCRLKVDTRGPDPLVWDRLKRRWLKLTPEEWVRCHLIEYLVDNHGIQPGLIVREHAVCMQGAPQRADVVVFSPDCAAPLLLAECKAPEVNIDQAVMDQAFRYNAILGAEKILLTNGLTHYIYTRNADGTYAPAQTLEF